MKSRIQGINSRGGEAHDIVYKPSCLGHFVITAQTDLRHFSTSQNITKC